MAKRRKRKLAIGPANGATQWASRITSSGIKPAGQFLANPAQWKQHPHAQERALVSVLDRVGWVQSVIENVRTGHLIDGHMRVAAALAQGEGTPVPFVQVDIDERDERLLLAFMDRVTGAAVTDDEQYDALLASLADVSDDVSAILVRPKRAKGLRHNVLPCTCCKHGCAPGCGCYREAE